MERIINSKGKYQAFSRQGVNQSSEFSAFMLRDYEITRTANINEKTTKRIRK